MAQTAMQERSLLDRLAAHRTIGGIPRDQLEWLANVGYLRTLEAGEVLTKAGDPPLGLFVILDGHLSIRVDRGAGSHIVMEWHGGDVTGLLPYSRIKSPPGTVMAEERTSLLVVKPVDVPRMINECHELTAELVHIMVDRARVFKSSELHDEKMASLGRLAAGLAHELNNPASAVARSAKMLTVELQKLEECTREFCELNLSDAQRASIASLRDERTANPLPQSPIEIADREDALADWLDEKDISGVALEPLAASGFQRSDLDAIETTVGTDKVGAVLSQISSGQTVRRLTAEINAAASRIHALVDAVKGFTYMDQQAAVQPIAIARGLTDTITVLGAKARSKSTEITVNIAPDLPTVDGRGGELNQVWANLLDNAIDAAPGGHIRVTAGVELGKVVVRVKDDGPGIPADVLARIFDPFYTTKPVGEGTGLGLDIARRIVEEHHGVIDVATDEHGTEFSVTLPVSRTSATTSL